MKIYDNVLEITLLMAVLERKPQCCSAWIEPHLLLAKKPGRQGPDKIDTPTLLNDVRRHPDKLLRERAKLFDVTAAGVFRALKRLNIKKTLKYIERKPEQRIPFLQQLRERVKHYGGQSIVYVDESSFSGSAVREYGSAERGQKIYGDRPGKRQQRTSLLLAQSRTKRFSPLLFERTCNTILFNTWLKTCLLPELKPEQTVVMDNAAIHKNPETKKLLEEIGCHLLFLPPYSPDFNPIEKTFGSLKNKRPFMPKGATLDELVCSIL